MPSDNNGNMVMPIIWMAAALLYDVSPLDVIPDVPVIGWIDDFFITATATLNLIQKAVEDSVPWLAQIAKNLKWIMIILGIIAIILVVLCGTLILSLLK